MRTASKYADRCYIPRCWYHAEILSMEGDYATVIFVNYGNQLTVPLTEIFQVLSEDLKTQPKLVVECKLGAVEPEGEDGWSEAAKKYFASLLDCDEFHLTVTFLAQEQDVYTVSLKSRNGTSIAENFVQLECGQVEILSNTIHEHVLNYLKLTCSVDSGRISGAVGGRQQRQQLVRN